MKDNLNREINERPPFSDSGKSSPFSRIPYGAVYFRKSNPPKQDWAKDYKTAGEDGINIFRHWFLWSAIEIAPGKYDWSDYDRQLDLAAENNIKTIIAEMTTFAPFWAYRQFSHARYENINGMKLEGKMQGSCASGGIPGLCFDNDDVKAYAQNFLEILVKRYKDHPGLGGYDIWNECNIAKNICFCSQTTQKFRDWLKIKYKDLKSVADTWHCYSFTSWEDILPPRYLTPYPNVMDWLEFRNDNAYRLMRWRFDTIKKIDPHHSITAHGVAASLSRMAPNCANDWRAAAEVESYGYTWGSSRHGDEPWKQFHAVDLVRAASHGKPFWHAEAYGGPLWMAPQVQNKPRDEGRIASPEDIRYWNLVSFMAGASGLLYLRWRPLLHGPLFGAFGPYGMDGSRNIRSEMSKKIGQWINADQQKPLWQAKPIKGDIGILYIPESQIFTYAQQNSTEYFFRSMQGAYQGFFDNNIQADWVYIDHINEYDSLYLPFPIMLKAATAERLKQWIHNGGTLICEGCPAYFGDYGRAGEKQPQFGLDQVFGAKESYIEFTPDLLENLEFELNDIKTNGGIFLQAFELNGGKKAGEYKDGQIAAVDHKYGRGRTRLIGTMCGAGYKNYIENNPAKNQTAANFFTQTLQFAKIEQHVSCSDQRVKARVHHGQGKTFLWIANPKRFDLNVSLQLSTKWNQFSDIKVLRKDKPDNNISQSGDTIKLTAEARNVIVLQLI